jgi:hypothetical protein
MGFELHITRKENWYDADPTLDIALAEWLRYVAQDSEFRLDNYAQVELPDGGVLRTEEEGIAVWTAYSGEGSGQDHALFTYFRGCIDVKNPDQEIINKMVDIAEALGAKVQDDEGTVYGKEAYLGRQGKDVQVGAEVGKRKWWRFW